ncbi:hypothetical protein D3C81_1251270 [compost metagenome]
MSIHIDQREAGGAADFAHDQALQIPDIDVDDDVHIIERDRAGAVQYKRDNLVVAIEQTVAMARNPDGAFALLNLVVHIGPIE